MLRVCTAVALLSWSGWAASSLETLNEVVACANGNVPQSTFSQQVGVSAFDRLHKERRYVARLYGQRVNRRDVNMMLRAEHPADLEGSRYLVRGRPGPDDMYVYLPALNAVRKLESDQSTGTLWGTDFSYQDIQQIFGIFTDGPMQRLDDAQVDGRSTYVIDVTPDPATGSPYQRILTHVDTATCLALMVEFYEQGDRPRKRLSMNPDVVSKEDGRFVGHEYHMQDLAEGTRTTLYLGDVVYADALPADAFDPKHFVDVE